MLYKDCLRLVASNKQLIYVGRRQSESLEYGQLLSKRGRSVQNKSAIEALSQVEDKHESTNQLNYRLQAVIETTKAACRRKKSNAEQAVGEGGSDLPMTSPM